MYPSTSKLIRQTYTYRFQAHRFYNSQGFEKASKRQENSWGTASIVVWRSYPQWGVGGLLHADKKGNRKLSCNCLGHLRNNKSARKAVARYMLSFARRKWQDRQETFVDWLKYGCDKTKTDKWNYSLQRKFLLIPFIGTSWNVEARKGDLYIHQKQLIINPRSWSSLRTCFRLGLG